jgi:hypothetical protein
VPIAVERLTHWVFVRGGVALALPLAGFGIWSLCINGAAGGPALGSAIVVWLFAVALSHLMFWPMLLLLSAGVWRDIAPLPEEVWASSDAVAPMPRAPPPPPMAPPEQQARPPKRGMFGGARGGGGGKDDAAAALAGVTVMAPSPPSGGNISAAYADNPFAEPVASPTSSVWGASDGRDARRAPTSNTGAW